MPSPSDNIMNPVPSFLGSFPAFLRLPLSVLLLCALAPFQLIGAATAKSDLSYNRDIRPILSENCYFCHGPDTNKRKAGLRLDVKEEAFKKLESGDTAIVPGDPGKSKLIQLLTTHDEDDRMPPSKSGKKLSEKEVNLLTRWIQEGAAWEGHWAYTPPTRPATPEVKHKEKVRNEIDAFLVERLEKDGLTFRDETDKTSLIRRVTLDLTGLPPTLEEIDAFLADQNSNAYEALVDRLLASPHYGERMGQNWLDAARYADTNGYHIDNHRDMYKWREWVINSFNSNKRFDEFTVEQLAGDLLPNPTLDQKIATGFNRNGMVNFEGGADPDEYATKYVVDRVVTTSTVYLGSTIGCAECHDHKYDPFSQKEFYQLYAFFNNVPEKGLDGNKDNPVPSLRIPTADQGVKLAELIQRLPEAEEELRKREAELPAAQIKWEEEYRAQTNRVSEVEGYLARFDFDDKVVATEASRSQKPTTYKGGTAAFAEGRWGKALKLTGAADQFVDASSTADFERNEGFSIGAWIKPEGKGGVIVARMDDTNSFRGYDLGWVDGKLWVHLSSAWDTNAIKVVSKDAFPVGVWQHILATYDGSSKAAGVKLYVNGKPVEAVIDKDALIGTIRTSAPLMIGKRTTGFPFNGLIDDVRLYTRAVSAPEANDLNLYPTFSIVQLPADQRTPDQKAALARHYKENLAPAYKQAQASLAELRKSRETVLNALPASMVMEEMKEPRKTYILGRGDFRNKTEVVTPELPKAFPAMAEGLPANRLGLARWLVAPNHPLTARVTINRYWAMFFGTGLVKTVNDFGSQGEWPSHPELLDWLSTEFVARGWDMKAMVKLMVTSAAYRQSAAVTPELLEKDPYNRLISRGPRFRMDAEMIRDNALAISGLLNKKIGGKSVFPYQPPGLWEEVAFGGEFSSQTYVQSKGEDLFRRGMYTYWKRSLPYPSFVTFDAPNREICTVQRPRTSTPLQSLVLLNDPAYVEAARGLAQRIMQHRETDLQKRLTYAFRLTLARQPKPAELAVLEKVYRAQLEVYQKDKEAAKALISVGESVRPPGLDDSELAAWTALGNVLLNLDETITKG